MAEAQVVDAKPQSTADLLRQFAVLVALAATVAVGVAVALWSQTPTYGLLYGSLSNRDVTEVMSSLESADIPFKVDHATGAVLVPNAQIHEARIKLAAAGLPRSASMGFEMLDQDQGFGTSQFIERARYQRALEGELARSISQISTISSARVHIAVPKQSVFLRDRVNPSASVIVDLFPGRTLEDGQVAAISHLVASSVPELSTDGVTVVDQRGRLLTHADAGEDMRLAARQLEYTRQIEEDFVARIRNILGPIVGHDRVRPQVTADLDFTASEQTYKTYNPDLPAVRSEKVMEETQTGPGGAQGVPGALTNQPPGGAVAPETTQVADPENAAGGVPQQNQRRQEVRNFELDESIVHTKSPVGLIKRLSVAVVVDNKTTLDDEGQPVKTPLTEDEIARYTALVQQAVGFNEARGDTVHVASADFTVPERPEPLPDPPVWQQPWVWDVGKQALGGLFVLFLVLGVLRPFMRQMMSKVQPVQALPALAGPGGAAAALPGAGDAPQLEASNERRAPPKLAGALSDNADLATIQAFANEDPKLTAQVVKTWVGDE